MDATLIRLLPLFNMTLLVPDDNAFKSISGPDLAAISSTSSGWLQLIAFHVIFPAYTSTDFKALPAGASVCSPPVPYPLPLGCLPPRYAALSGRTVMSASAFARVARDCSVPW